LSYTYAKADSTTGTGDGGGSATEGPFGGGNYQDQFNPSSNRAASALDQRHRGNLYFTWDLPWKSTGVPLVDVVFKGWAINSIFTGETGRPYSPVITLASLQFLGTDGQLYNGFGGLRGQGSSSDRNVVPTLGRDSVYGDNNYRLDVRIARRFSIGERLKVEFFGEAFNIANHANYNGYNATAYTSVATATTTALATPVILNKVTNFGTANNDGSQPDGTNARRLQVSMRLKF
jgi:hypothetical protein